MGYKNKHKCEIKRAYYDDVWTITEINKSNLPNINLRGKKYNLDHIIPISFGFEYNIDPSIIGSFDNIRIISFEDNFKKNQRITEEVMLKLIHYGIDLDKITKRVYSPKIKPIKLNKKELAFTENKNSLLYWTKKNQKLITQNSSNK